MGDFDCCLGEVGSAEMGDPVERMADALRKAMPGAVVKVEADRVRCPDCDGLGGSVWTDHAGYEHEEVCEVCVGTGSVPVDHVDHLDHVAPDDHSYQLPGAKP